MKKIYAFSLIAFVAVIALILGGILMILSSESDFGDGNIAVINLDDMIVSKTEDSGLFGEIQPDVNDYINLLEEAENNDNIDAVILRINSPGGEVIASEKLARKIKEASEKKTVVAYIETLGASGSYMAAASTDYIVAEKHSIVGSIGVRMDIVHYYGLMEKLGVNATVIKAGEYKDIGSPYRPMTPEEKAYLEKMINETYLDFVKWVAENRNMTLNETLKVADGKIYSGSDAQKVGLVDEVGTEEDAINAAARLANISSPKTVEYNPADSLGLFGVVYNLGYGIGKGFGETMNMAEKFKSYNLYY